MEIVESSLNVIANEEPSQESRRRSYQRIAPCVVRTYRKNFRFRVTRFFDHIWARKSQSESLDEGLIVLLLLGPNGIIEFIV